MQKIYSRALKKYFCFVFEISIFINEKYFNVHLWNACTCKEQDTVFGEQYEFKKTNAENYTLLFIVIDFNYAIDAEWEAD